MGLSLFDLKDNAIRFSQEWADAKRENSEAKPFWVDFFRVFGINSLRRLATFESPVKKLSGKQGFIDLLWKGTLLVEHKSYGEDLDKALLQAKDYFPGLKDYELPKYVLVSDFARFRLYDLDEDTSQEFALAELHQHLHLFSFITGYQKREYRAEDPANIEAAELMGALHDALLANGYTGHKLEVLLVRILFCLFAEDTTIFEKDAFRSFIEDHTRDDGSDVGPRLAEWFAVLDKPEGDRQRTLAAYLKELPYVNGSLFTEFFEFPAFDAKLRQHLIRCTYFDWSRISPAIFGSLFQSVTDATKRRNLGAHYTSEQNILKVIRGLFLDELEQQLQAVGHNRQKLDQLHQRIARIKFFDPSCGCGNFLVVTYRELRVLEMEILRRQFTAKLATGQTLDLSLYALVNVDQAYGLEIEEFPARIAEVAMWLMDHQMNLRLSEAFGNLYVRLPLVRTAKIVHGNALTVSWESVVAQDQLSYILGNPPFIGSKMMTDVQRKELLTVTGPKLQGAGVLDYVAAWYLKAAQYIQGTRIRVALVSTNSITQGEQVSILWGEMLDRYGIHILFAHRTFKWSNEARGNANVFCVIVGFGQDVTLIRRLFEYATPKSMPQELRVKNINPYLVDAADVLVAKLSKPLAKVPEISYGSMANDGGHLLLSDTEKKELLAMEPNAGRFIRPFVGSQEFINNIPRWCLWLKDASPSDIRNLPEVAKRIEAVRAYRKASKRLATVKLADFPSLFGELRQPTSEYILIPGVSSENRRYIPIGFMPPEVIASDLCRTIPNATRFHFGILTSQMHMAWMRAVCGRLKSDFRYSGLLVYNTYPFPSAPTQKQVQTVEGKAQQIIDIRAKYVGESLATLYDPLSMPSDLVKAHQELDRAVDQCYRSTAFPTELSRLEFLFEQYRELTITKSSRETKKAPKRQKDPV